MAIKIKNPENSVYTPLGRIGVCEILTDTEAEILSLTDVVDDGTNTVRLAPGSVAYTADMSAVYQLSPSEVWTKM